NRLVQQIRSGLVKRTLDLLDKLAADDKEKYASFWKEFGAVLKEGVAEDHGNRERVAKLLRFTSTASPGRDPDTSLDDYIARMKEVLGERVRDVRASQRLTDSASCLVCDEHDMGPQMARLLKQAGHEVPASKPILEINPGHPLVKRLEAEADPERARDLGEI